MAKVNLTSTRLKVSEGIDDINDYLYEHGETDGFPVIPPTPERVEAMLAAVNRDPQEVVAKVAPAFGEATVEKIAINAVMAGCRPEYLPVIIAAVEAMTQPRFGLMRIQPTTNPVAPLLVVNGPIRKKLGINCGHNCLGQGCRSNATIGRAIRLIMINIGGGIPGVTDMACMGQPGKYSFCCGENEEENPWQPFHVEKGFHIEDSTATVFAAVSIINIVDTDSQSADEVLTTIAGTMTGQGYYTMNWHTGEPLVVLCSDHAKILIRDGLTKDEVKRELWQKAAVPLSSFAKGVQEGMLKRGRQINNGMVHAADKPEDISILVAGGDGPHTVFVPVFGGPSVTVKITE